MTKQIIMERFARGDIRAVLATKAFGMGVDVNDIEVIYHHAPSGGLADYVQEIGRVARSENLQGTALIDFCSKDLKFTKILYGLSSVKQHQVRLVLQKLWNIYSIEKRPNLLVTVEDFGHIFPDEGDKESKVKSALMLLERDLVEKHNFNVILARPKSLFSTAFACIPESIKEAFLGKYGGYLNRVCSRAGNVRNMSGGVVYDHGDTFEIELDRLWKDRFGDDSFPMIKWKFFEGELFKSEYGERIDPRYKLSIVLGEAPEDTLHRLGGYFEILNSTITEFGDKSFTKNELAGKLQDHLRSEPLARRVADLIVNIYSDYSESRASYGKESSGAIQARRGESDELRYRIVSRDFVRAQSDVLRYMTEMFSTPSRTYSKFLPYDARKTDRTQRIAYAIEAFDLGSYQTVGGQYPKIFIRINDPFRLRRISEEQVYRNQMVQDVDRRHYTSVKIMEKFFLSDMSNEDRWDFVENYFLGRDVLLSGSVLSNAG